MVKNRQNVDFLKIEIIEGIIHESYVSPFSKKSHRIQNRNNLDFAYDIGLLKTSYPVIVSKIYSLVQKYLFRLKCEIFAKNT